MDFRKQVKMSKWKNEWEHPWKNPWVAEKDRAGLDLSETPATECGRDGEEPTLFEVRDGDGNLALRVDSDGVTHMSKKHPDEKAGTLDDTLAKEITRSYRWELATPRVGQWTKWFCVSHSERTLDVSLYDVADGTVEDWVEGLCAASGGGEPIELSVNLYDNYGNIVGTRRYGGVEVILHDFGLDYDDPGAASHSLLLSFETYSSSERI